MECEFCEPPPVLDISQSKKVLEHNAGHILHDPKVKRSDEPCGLCLRPSPLCVFYIKKGKGANASLTVDKKRSVCKYPIKFYYQKAVNSMEGSPCSNVPILCPICGPKAPAVWKYNLHAHFQHKHPSQLTNSKYTQLWHLTNFEKHEVSEIWKKRHNISVRRSNQPNDDDLPVSDVHKSTNAAM